MLAAAEISWSNMSCKMVTNFIGTMADCIEARFYGNGDVTRYKQYVFIELQTTKSIHLKRK